MQGVYLYSVRLCSHTASSFTFFRDFLCLFQDFFLTLKQTQIVHQGKRVIYLIGKRTLRTLSSTCRSRKSKHIQEDAQPERPHWVYLYPVTSFAFTLQWNFCNIQYHTTWAISSCLSLYMGNARAYTWDKREVEHPRLFHSLNSLLTAESRVAVGIKTLCA